MSITIDLPQMVEAQIQQRARAAGVSLAEVVTQLVQENLDALPASSERQKQQNAASIALLQKWLQRGEIQEEPAGESQQEPDLEELMRCLNATRLESGERLPYPEPSETP